MTLPFTRNQLAWGLRIIFPTLLILPFLNLTNIDLLLGVILLFISFFIWFFSFVMWDFHDEIKFKGDER